MKRYYKRTSDGAWTMRVDGNPSISASQSAAAAEAEYGFAVTVVDVADGSDPRTGDLLAPPSPPQPPDVPGFMLAVYAPVPTGIGKDRARLFARDYPDGPIALQRGNWAIARQAVTDAAANVSPLLMTLTVTEKNAVLALMDTFHIPGGS